MTQYEQALLTYLQNRYADTGNIYSSVTEVFVDPEIDLGDMDIISRVFHQLEDDGFVERNGYKGDGYTLLKTK